MQYTIRKIPAEIDEEMRRRSQRDGKSLNEVAIEALAQGLGFGEDGTVYRDVSDIAGTWKKDAATEAALAEQDQVDDSLWK